MTDLLLGENRYTIVIAEPQSVSQLISLGDFIRVDAQITSDRFPAQAFTTSPVQVVIANIRDNNELTTGQVLEWMNIQSLRPVGIHELLALAALRPHIVLPNNPQALGSIWRDGEGRRFVAGCRLRYRRLLRLSCIHSEPWWSSTECFPCVREPRGP